MAKAATRPRRNYTTLIVLVGCLTFIYIHFGGPIQTGAIFFLLPSLAWPTDHGTPAAYQPLHKGSIDLVTGLYVRVNEDLIVAGTPPLVVRRTYVSRYHDKRQFGIGTTHDGEVWLYPEDRQLQRVSLIRSDGGRIGFDRISSGTSVSNAMFEHRDSPTDFRGARLGWTGFNWALQKADGSVAVFQSCGPFIALVCSIVSWRDADNHKIRFRRDGRGPLTRMESGDRWIAFEYDVQDRIARATASTGQSVRYEYDARSRLTRATNSEKKEYRYTYTDKDELATIAEPNATIENYYDEKGYCIRQVNRFSDTPVPFVYGFSYRLNGKVVAETETRRSDGTWERITFDPDRYAVAETVGFSDEEIAFAYDRHPISHDVQSVAVTCAGRSGQKMTHSSLLRDGDVDAMKADLVRTHCRRSWRRATPSDGRLDAVASGLQSP